jgi:hypothetical protein
VLQLLCTMLYVVAALACLVDIRVHTKLWRQEEGVDRDVLQQSQQQQQQQQQQRTVSGQSAAESNKRVQHVVYAIWGCTGSGWRPCLFASITLLLCLHQHQLNSMHCQVLQT